MVREGLTTGTNRICQTRFVLLVSQYQIVKLHNRNKLNVLDQLLVPIVNFVEKVS